jgi:hypothetical protein
MRRSGKINVGCILMTAVLVVGGIAAFKIIPVRVKAAEIKEAVKRAAEQAATNSHYKNENVVASILEAARENNLPINEKQIKIDRSGREIHVEVNYQVTVDIVRYKYTMTFSPYYDAPRFD